MHFCATVFIVIIEEVVTLCLVLINLAHSNRVPITNVN
jgi:hypothetical protein